MINFRSYLLVILMSFKSSALLSFYMVLKCWGLDLLIRSHSRISVGATCGSFLSREKTHPIHFMHLENILGFLRQGEKRRWRKKTQEHQV